MTRYLHTFTQTISFALLFAFMLVLASATFTPAHAQSTTTAVPLCEIQRNLTIGASGEDVRCLQKYLNWSGFPLASFGVGSAGNETPYFGPLTANAVARWQNAHAATVLTPLGLPSGTGFWGASSFSHYVGFVRIALGL